MILSPRYGQSGEKTQAPSLTQLTAKARLFSMVSFSAKPVPLLLSIEASRIEGGAAPMGLTRQGVDLSFA